MPRTQTKKKTASSKSTALITSPIANDVLKRKTVAGHGQFDNWMMASFNMGPEPECNIPAVDQHSVLSIAPYFRAIDILCGLVGRIEVNMKRRLAHGKSQNETEDDRHFMMKKKPHAGLKARTLKKTMMLHLQIAPGGGFSEIIRDPNDGKPLAVVPLDPNRMAWAVIGEGYFKKMVYLYQDNLDLPHREIEVNNVMHFKGLSYDCIMGMDKTDLHKEEFGLILARRQYAQKYFIGNAHLRGVLMIPAGMKPELLANIMTVIKKHMDEQTKDPMKIVPLFDGIKYQATQDDPEKSQLAESIKMTPATASQLTGVPEFFLGGEVKGSYNAIEQIMEGFFVTTVDDLFDEFESEMDDKLLFDDEQRKDELYFQFNRKRLQAMNVAKFRKMLRDDFHGGLLAWEEARSELGDSVDQQGGTFFMPQNIIGANPTQLGSSGKPPSNAKKPKTPNQRGKSASMSNLADHTMVRLCDRIGKSAVGACKSAKRFEKWLTDLRTRESDLVTQSIEPVVNMAIASGLINRPPKFDLVALYHDRLTKFVAVKSPENVVAAECDEIKTLVRQQFPRLCIGAQ